MPSGFPLRGGPALRASAAPPWSSLRDKANVCARCRAQQRTWAKYSAGVCDGLVRSSARQSCDSGAVRMQCDDVARASGFSGAPSNRPSSLRCRSSSVRDEFAVAAFAFVAQLLQFVREVQRGQHGDAIERGHAVAAADLAHLAVEQLGGGHQAVAFVGLAADVYSRSSRRMLTGSLALRTHVCCSSDFSRAIIASTRVRACSFLASSVERSPTSCSCCCAGCGSPR